MEFGRDDDGEIAADAPPWAGVIPEYVPCPSCHAPIDPDAERCLFCGEEVPAKGRPWWFVLGLVLSLAVVAWWVVSSFMIF